MSVKIKFPYWTPILAKGKRNGAEKISYVLNYDEFEIEEMDMSGFNKSSNTDTITEMERVNGISEKESYTLLYSLEGLEKFYLEINKNPKKNHENFLDKYAYTEKDKNFNNILCPLFYGTELNRKNDFLSEKDLQGIEILKDEKEFYKEKIQIILKQFKFDKKTGNIFCMNNSTNIFHKNINNEFIYNAKINSIIQKYYNAMHEKKIGFLPDEIIDLYREVRDKFYFVQMNNAYKFPVLETLLFCKYDNSEEIVHKILNTNGIDKYFDFNGLGHALGKSNFKPKDLIDFKNKLKEKIELKLQKNVL